MLKFIRIALLRHQMGRKNKLKRFAEVAAFPNVFEVDPAMESFLSNAEGMSEDLRGRWARRYFNNSNPVILELACGKGDYTVALAQDYPGKNFIGVDIKGARMWIGAKKALETDLKNAAFLRTRIEFIDRFFAPGEVSEIWITFPDPFEGKANRRLTSPPFLDRYRKFLKPDGVVHLKTDSDLLYEYTMEILTADPKCEILYSNDNIYKNPLDFPELEYKTYYEKKHLLDGRTIKYVRSKI